MMMKISSFFFVLLAGTALLMVAAADDNSSLLEDTSEADRSLLRATGDGSNDRQLQGKANCNIAIKCAEGYVPHPPSCPTMCLFRGVDCKKDSDCSVQCFSEPCPIATCNKSSGKCMPQTSQKPPKGEDCGGITCPKGQVCCNPSCQICTDPDGFCIQIACL